MHILLGSETYAAEIPVILYDHSKVYAVTCLATNRPILISRQSHGIAPPNITASTVIFRALLSTQNSHPFCVFPSVHIPTG